MQLRMDGLDDIFDQDLLPSRILFISMKGNESFIFKPHRHTLKNLWKICIYIPIRPLHPTALNPSLLLLHLDAISLKIHPQY
mmetsp:Transcript_25079/g.37483  ORF Transcript_25079/g.37483 Transcript_25079/m.37483 type:complete len:82 (-) Transcript_25079:19-264(-)